MNGCENSSWSFLLLILFFPYLSIHMNYRKSYGFIGKIQYYGCINDVIQIYGTPFFFFFFFFFFGGGEGGCIFFFLFQTVKF